MPSKVRKTDDCIIALIFRVLHVTNEVRSTSLYTTLVVINYINGNYLKLPFSRYSVIRFCLLISNKLVILLQLLISLVETSGYLTQRLFLFNVPNNQHDYKIAFQVAEVALQRCSYKRCFENMQQIYKRTPIPKCDFNMVVLHVLRIITFYKNTAEGLLLNW